MPSPRSSVRNRVAETEPHHACTAATKGARKRRDLFPKCSCKSARGKGIRSGPKFTREERGRERAGEGGQQRTTIDELINMRQAARLFLGVSLRSQLDLGVGHPRQTSQSPSARRHQMSPPSVATTHERRLFFFFSFFSSSFLHIQMLINLPRSCSDNCPSCVTNTRTTGNKTARLRLPATLLSESINFRICPHGFVG